MAQPSFWQPIARLWSRNFRIRGWFFIKGSSAALPPEAAARLPRLLLHKTTPVVMLAPWVMALFFMLNSVLLGAGVLGQTVLQQWQSGLRQTLTIQLTPMNNADDTQRIAEDMVNFLWAMDDVAHVELISDEAVATMLKPWLGEASSSSLFALPVVIDVTLLDGSTLDAPALREQLSTITPDIQVDHHQAWLRSLQGIIDVGQGVALALLGVIIGVTILTIIGLTRITLALNRDIIEVLQFCGATDAFIADQFVASMVRIMVRAIALGMVVGVVVLASAWAALPTGVWLTPIQQGNLLVLAMVIGLLAFISLSLAIVCSRFAAIRALKHG